MILRNFIVSVSLVLLHGCAYNSANDSDNANLQYSARAKLLAEMDNPQDLKRTSSPFPKGKKKLGEPALKGISGRSCEEAPFAINDLEIINIGLSNRDSASAINLLGTMGYNILADDGNSRSDTSAGFSCSDLPLILAPKQPEEIAGGKNYQNNNETKGTGNLQIKALNKVNSIDLDQLIVFYHESQSKKLNRLKQTIDSVIDIAAPQVYIEIMVLEVSEEDSKELGVSYQTSNIGGSGGNNILGLGALEVGGDDTLSITRDTTRDANGDFNFIPGTGIEAKVKALVDKGKAEVLARPSILTLSNRQAVIQIVDVIQSPVVQSSIGGSGDLIISAYDFEPLLLGITFNLRPRVSSDRKWVSMEIDATVESEIDENSGTVNAPDGAGGSIVLAEKKGSSSRNVKTLVRIPDRTPIIIGGLVAGKNEKLSSKVPFLGGLPIIGSLFGATDNEVQKREIVIVLTPHVLAEDSIGIRTNRASDSVMQRQTDLKLFNNYYKIAANDVYDMNFLLSDTKFLRYRQHAKQLVQNSTENKTDKTLNAFADDRFPGDDILVTKMIFDIVSSNLIRPTIDLKNIFIPSVNKIQGGSLVSLAELFGSVDFLKQENMLTLSTSTNENGKTQFAYEIVGQENIPVVNNSDSITIRTESDLQRLLAAITTDIIVRKNGNFPALNLQTFIPGSNISLDEEIDYQGLLVSEEVLKIYNSSKNFNQTIKLELDKAYKHIDNKYKL